MRNWLIVMAACVRVTLNACPGTGDRSSWSRDQDGTNVKTWITAARFAREAGCILRPRWSRVLLLALGLAALTLPPTGQAQDADSLSNDFIKVFTTVSYIATVKGFCDTSAPTTSAANAAALEKWRKANDSDQIERLTQKMVQRNPEIKTTLERIRAKMLEKVQKAAAGRETAWCGQFPALLDEPDTQVGQKYKDQIARLNALLDKTANSPATTPPATTGGSSPPASPVPNAAQGAFSLEPGHYACTRFETYLGSWRNQYKDTAEPAREEFDVFPNGEYSSEKNAFIPVPSSPLDWPETVGRYRMYFNADVQLNQIAWQTGKYGEYSGRIEKNPTDRDRGTYYKIGKDGRQVVILKTDDYGDHLATIECHRDGASKRKTPTQLMQVAETPDTYLQPASVKAAPPPPGSGGLEGVYLAERPLYLTKSGYLYRQSYRWGFDKLDCTRVGVPGGPFKKCLTYQRRGNTLQISGDDEAQRFEQRQNGQLVIGDSVYVPIKPIKAGTRLEGSFKYTYSVISGSGGGGGSKTLKLGKDGAFTYGEDSFGAVSGVDTYTTFVNSDQNPNSGTYTLEGYGITLNFVTGLKLRYSFLLDPSGKAFYMIGSRYDLDK